MKIDFLVERPYRVDPILNINYSIVKFLKIDIPYNTCRDDTKEFVFHYQKC